MKSKDLVQSTHVDLCSSENMMFYWLGLCDMIDVESLSLVRCRLGVYQTGHCTLSGNLLIELSLIVDGHLRTLLKRSVHLSKIIIWNSGSATIKSRNPSQASRGRVDKLALSSPTEVIDPLPFTYK